MSSWSQFLVSRKSYPIQLDVPFVNYGPKYSKVDDKAGHDLGYGYFVNDKSQSQFFTVPPSCLNMVTSGSKKTRCQLPKCQSQGLKMVVHKPMGDVMLATSTFFYTVSGQWSEFLCKAAKTNPQESPLH